MVAESHQVSSFSKLTLELAWGAHYSRRRQTRLQAEPLQNWGRIRFQIDRLLEIEVNATSSMLCQHIGNR